MQNPIDILEENRELFKNVYIDGFNQKGFGVLVVDTNENKTIYIAINELDLLDDHYETEYVHVNITNYFRMNEPVSGYMYICMIIDEEMNIISSDLRND